MVKADPKSAQAQLDVALSYQRLGELHLQQGASHLKRGDSVRASESYIKAIQLFESIASADPNYAQAQRKLAYLYQNLGGIYQKRGDTAKARESFAKGVQQSEALARADPTNALGETRTFLFARQSRRRAPKARRHGESPGIVHQGPAAGRGHGQGRPQERTGASSDVALS